MHDGERIKEARERLGLSQDQLSRELATSAGCRPADGPGRNQVHRWEKGKRRPRMWRRHLESVLGIDLHEGRGHTILPAGTSTEEGMVPVDRRQFIGAGAVAGVAVSAPQAAGAGRRIGRADVARFAQRVADLRRLDDYAGGASVYPMVTREIGHLSALATNGSYTEVVGRALLSTLGELYQFAAWTAFDAERTQDARRLSLLAANAANQAGNHPLAATALSELSYVTASSDSPAEGVAMARASLANAPADVLPAVRVVLADRLAWACARTGDAAGAERALGTSEDAHDRRDPAAAEEPDSVYWINRDESRIMAGRVWAELRRPERAVPVLEALTAPYDDTHARELALYTCWLAGAHLSAGDLDRATAAALRAFELSRGTASPRTDALLRALLTDFEPHRDNRQVNDLLTHAAA
ncbi:helix-turn-helix transcriptional regulator [Streptomyces sp. DSM 44917]|uniref:Helix-turn-helix transcriptional regulator n=1 Tax=Streptomyces boetiae TaxID=3075541 RepID=A0ABU2LD41_9ACTN|nr:helix-turn-helix transcriptional regulator [Streptomyces sp. DSM 44917]MDT0309490.1 helix-turn-helix transcriptional regulator [Streptomyces sp. DSM 44917]